MVLKIQCQEKRQNVYANQRGGIYGTSFEKSKIYFYILSQGLNGNPVLVRSQMTLPPFSQTPANETQLLYSFAIETLCTWQKKPMILLKGMTCILASKFSTIFWAFLSCVEWCVLFLEFKSVPVFTYSTLDGNQIYSVQPILPILKFLCCCDISSSNQDHPDRTSLVDLLSFWWSICLALLFVP